ncbi:MAG: hypothetical protein ACTSXY_12430 [Promethearchaeota archaeon]
MKKSKIEVGEIRPIYNITGFQVCKVVAEKLEDSEWTLVEKQSDAEILSWVYQQNPEPKKVGKSKKLETTEDNLDEEVERLQKQITELKETQIDDEDL